MVTRGVSHSLLLMRLKKTGLLLLSMLLIGYPSKDSIREDFPQEFSPMNTNSGYSILLFNSLLGKIRKKNCFFGYKFFFFYVFFLLFFYWSKKKNFLVSKKNKKTRRNFFFFFTLATTLILLNAEYNSSEK